jgi:sodium/hydrogen exchanger 8
MCALAGALISATDPVATLSIFSTLDVPPLLYNLVTCPGG